jgi:hypothetical protein
MTNLDNSSDKKSFELRRARLLLIKSAAGFPLILILGYGLSEIFDSGLPFLLLALISFAVVTVFSVRFFYLHLRSGVRIE